MNLKEAKEKAKNIISLNSSCDHEPSCNTDELMHDYDEWWLNVKCFEKKLVTALLSSYKAGMIRAAEISRNTDTGDTHGYWIAQAIEKEAQENGDEK